MEHINLPETNTKTPMPDCKPPKVSKTDDLIFKDYESRPIIRKAYEIKPSDVISVVDESTAMIGQVKFKHYEKIKPWDFIVYLDDADIYHYSRKVFMERNIVR